MKWKRQLIRHGEVRDRRGFLFLPKQINGEMRWLEWARWEVRAFRWHDGLIGGLEWVSVRWLVGPIREGG